jgi:HSP20 family molecular chaperone IbpA
MKEVSIMLAPSIFGDGLFDDWFKFPEFNDLDRTEKKLYGRHADRLMKTDVHENDEGFEVDIDLPGFAKEEIQLELNDGYLTVSASKGLDKDEKDKKGKLIRQERYCGSMQRSFYVGDNLTEEDIKASFKHGVLNLVIPKKEAPKAPEKKYIAIAG